VNLSVIIPVHNEAGSVGHVVRMVRLALKHHAHEVIVADACSTDGCADEAREAGALVVRSAVKGRAAQMNAGAKASAGDVLFFLHADTLPPPDLHDQLIRSLSKGSDFGCMRLRFDVHRWPLRLKAWFTRFRASGLHYGDQGLFVRKALFDQVGGYDTSMSIFEDLDIIQRLQKAGRFEVLHGPITTSARKYEQNSALRMQLAFYVMYPLYRAGASQKVLVRTYTRLVRQDKI
jgi:rSAM/selenodomain-associated transferase 2